MGSAISKSPSTPFERENNENTEEFEMPFHYVAPDLSVAPQLTPQDIGVAASQGFRSVILNRPDGEAGDHES